MELLSATWKRSRRRRGLRIRILHALLRYRFELALFTLLIVTILVATFQNSMLKRTLVITPQNAHLFHPGAFTDSRQGGTSRVVQTGPMSWTCRLTKTYLYRYCTFELQFDPSRRHGLDLHRLEVARLVVDYRGPADSMRFNLKNFDRRYSHPPATDSDKFNVTEQMVAQRRNLIDLRRNAFTVAEWWITDHRIPASVSGPQFNNVVSLQVQTGTRAGPGVYRFAIRRITLERQLLTSAEVYAGLLGAWAVLICGFLMYRVVTLERDLKQRRAAQAAALRLAQHAEETARRDHLTRLLNRGGISDLYHSLAMSRREDQGFALLLLDIDRFKQINDRHGHAMGDVVLAGVARILTESTRAGDIAGRWGGEEFVLICAAADNAAAAAIAEKLRLTIAGHDFGISEPVTVSIGIHCCNGIAQELEVSIAYADIALYAAKADGRNRVQLYEPDLGRVITRR